MGICRTTVSESGFGVRIFAAGPSGAGRDLELSIDRMHDAGSMRSDSICRTGFITAVPTQAKVSYDVPKDNKGAKNGLNDLDYAIYLARQRGMFFWLQFCMSWASIFTPPIMT
jgi:hypothetical protein